MGERRRALMVDAVDRGARSGVAALHGMEIGRRRCERISARIF